MFQHVRIQTTKILSSALYDDVINGRIDLSDYFVRNYKNPCWYEGDSSTQLSGPDDATFRCLPFAYVISKTSTMHQFNATPFI